jgi:alcohol dehydrogenase
MTSAILGFDSRPRTRVVFGLNTLDRLGALACELSTHRALIVTDTHLVAAGHVGRACASLAAAGLEVTVFDGVRENPTTRDVDACLDVARSLGIDVLIGLGGGSSLDTAKGCNFLLTNGGRMQDYWGVGKATREMLPLIAVPTTAGTGSECQSFALIADEDTHQKMACGDPRVAPRVALLDPVLTVSQPRGVAACTGIDAISHAVETAVTRRRNELSLLYSREAFRLTINNLETVLTAPDNLDARGRMLLGAAYAGTAIENSMLGAAHSTANPLSAHFGVIHGHAVAMMLPHVVRFNAEQPAARQSYAELAVYAGIARPDAPEEDALDALISRLEEILFIAGLPSSLHDCGVTEEIVPQLAAEAATQWTAQFNPRDVSQFDFETLYRAALQATRSSRDNVTNNSLNADSTAVDQ